jgi:hypothetical protein
MADRYKFQFTESFYGKHVLLDGYVRVGSLGFVESGDGYLNVAGNALLLPKGLKSVVKNATAGSYTLSFGSPNTQASVSGIDTYWDVSFCGITPVCPSGTTEVTGNLKSVHMVAGTGAPGSVTQYVDSVTIQFQSSGSAVDLPTEGGFYILLMLQNSQVI